MDIPIEGFYLQNITTPLSPVKLHFKSNDKWLFRVDIESHIHRKYVTLESREDGSNEPITALCFWSNVDTITFPVGKEIQVPYSSHWWTYIYYVKSPKSIPGYNLVLRGFLLQHNPFTYNSQITLPNSKIAFQHKFDVHEKAHYLQPLIIGKFSKPPTHIVIHSSFRDRERMRLKVGKEVLVSKSSYDRICFVEKEKIETIGAINGSSHRLMTNNLDKSFAGGDAILGASNYLASAPFCKVKNNDCQPFSPFDLPKTLDEDLCEFLSKPGDVNLISSDEEAISCHSFLLKARSKKFQQILENEKIQKDKRISLNNYKTGVLRDLVHFLATDSIRNMKENATDLLLLAHEFSIHKLGFECVKHIRANKSEYDIFRLMEIAGRIRCDVLVKDLLSN